ncbi:MAG: hypothetical protein ACK56I_16725, partial [bacterium]
YIGVCNGSVFVSLNYSGLDQIHFGSEEIWRPDILLYNSAESGKVRMNQNCQRHSFFLCARNKCDSLHWIKIVIPPINKLSSSLEHLLKFLKGYSAKNKNCASHQGPYTERIDL